MFYVWCGSAWSRLAAVRTGLEGDQPGPHHQPGVRAAVGQRPRARRVRPTPSGSATGRPRSACSPSCGSSWSTPTPPSSARSGCGARCTSRVMLLGGALFGNRVLRARRPVRGLLHAGRQAVGLGPARRPAGRPQPAGQPRHRRRSRPAWSRGGGAVRQHGVRLLQGLQRRGSSSPSDAPPRRTCSTTSRCSAFCVGVGADLRGRHAWPPASGRAPAPADAAGPVRALGGADHRRLHRRPLPDLLRRGRPADADPAASDPLGSGANRLGTADLAGQLLAVASTRRSWPSSRWSRW